MFYDNLKHICENQGLKITPVVIECGGSSGSIANWKKGTIPNGEILVKLSKRLNVSIDYLLTGENFSSNHIMINGDAIQSKNLINSTINVPEQDEVTEEMIKVFKSLSVKEKIKVLNMVYEMKGE